MEVDQSGVETNFWDYDQPLSNIGPFKYLIRLLTATDDDWSAVVANLSEARRKWEQMSQIIGREVTYARTYGIFLKAVFQSILIFVSDTWVVVNPHIG